MKILVWNCPWASQGDLFFFEGCFERHLLKQANILAEEGHEVFVAYPKHLQRSALGLRDDIKHIVLPHEVVSLTPVEDEVLSYIYAKPESDFVVSIASKISRVLPEIVDVVLLWENPVPYLEAIYPNALIVNQMPGAFCRPPFPNTVTFDVMGLYSTGTLSNISSEMASDKYKKSPSNIGGYFRDAVIESLNKTADRNLERLFDGGGGYVLTPLQISNHYAYKNDSNFKNQLEFLSSVLDSDRDGIHVVTHYISKFAKEIVLTDNNYEKFKELNPNIMWDPYLDKIPSPSQLLLPLVNSVSTVSSSIGVQAAVLGKPVRIFGKSHIRWLDRANLHGLGSSPEHLADNLSDFLSDRYNVLYTSITEDGKFLTNLLEELRVSHNNTNIIEKTVSFSNIDSCYADYLIRSFNIEGHKKAMRKHSDGSEISDEEVAKYARFSSNDKAKAISFDVFDTLIFRPLENPSDLYAILAAKVDEKFGPIFSDFAKVRADSEDNARLESSADEISFDEIYNHIQEHYNLTSEVRDCIQRMEVDLEIDLVLPRKRGQALWQQALKSKKPVYLISDMYLSSDTVSKMLTKTGYRGYAKLFVSSEYGARKKSGGLYDLVLEELGLKGEELLHAGDHVIADIKQAQARGIRAFRVMRAIDILRRNTDFGAAWQGTSGAGIVGRGTIVGLIANKIYDHEPKEKHKGSLFQGNPWSLGYAGLGPLYTGFSLWLYEAARRDGVKKLYFLSREGYLLKQAYDLVAAQLPDAPASEYLYGSRRAIRVAALVDDRAVFELARQPYTEGLTLVELISQRYGLSAGVVEQRLRENSVDGEYKPPRSTEGRQKLQQAVSVLMNEILGSASKERSHYLAYLKHMGMDLPDSLAVVDVGWKGNMQGGLGRLLGRPLHGYYMATLAGAERWELEGHTLRAYLSNFAGPWTDNVILNHRHLMEALSCHTDQSTVTVRKTAAGFSPEFRSDSIPESHRALVKDIHRGARAFVRDYVKSFGMYLKFVRIEPEWSSLTLKRYMHAPHREDALMLRPLVFEDGFGGVAPKNIFDKSVHIWPAGSLALSPPRKAPVSSEVVKPAPVVRVPPVTASANVEGDIRARKMEAAIIGMISGAKGRAKYKTNSAAFFSESKSKLLRAWGVLR